MRLVIWGLIGAVTGFSVIFLTDAIQLDIDFLSVAYEGNIILTALTFLLLIYSAFNILIMRKKMRLNVSGEEEDAKDVWIYKKFSDTNFASVVGLVTGIAAFALSLITVQPFWVILTSAIAAFLACMFTIVVPSLINTFYPERNLPAVSEKNYGKKLLAASDEGERHVMLEGLYRSYTLLNAALVLSLLLLMVYSIMTEVSQLFAIFLIGAVLIGGNAQYYLVIRNRS
ncbi:DUF3169 family protein [Sporosarcina sp. A2]|uniref:DUF3169 family protein n=1 Tax=Sporosarcina sp. A2 TaxID=3393449 RepID=UPI003D79A7D8